MSFYNKPVSPAKVVAVIAVILVGSALFVNVLNNIRDIFPGLFGKYSLIQVFVISVLIMSGVAVKAFFDARSSAGSTPSSLASMERTLSSEVETLRKETERRLQPLEQRLDAAVAEVRTVAERIVQEKVNEEIGGDLLAAIGKRVAEQASDHARKEKLKSDITDAFNNSSTRIKAHAEASERTARLFRALGVGLALSGILLAAANLAMFYVEMAAGKVPQPGSGAGDNLQYFRHLPFTLPFIVLAEVLALIMFRYQSKALEMMRYFSNEVTTLTLRHAGALATIEYGTQKAVADLAGALLKAERNIILRKDEKTVEISQNRDEDALIKGLLDKLDARAKGKAGAPQNEAAGG